MDGERAPLAEIAEVGRSHGAMTVVDEAHAMLVLGDRGGGAAEAAGVMGEADLTVGTLGKAFGAHGGFVAGSHALREHLLNHGRSFVYSTSLPVPVAAAARAALAVFRAEPDLRERLRSHLEIVGRALGAEVTTPIVPVTLGSEARAIEVAEALLARGNLVPAIRPPTVPRGSARLRITLSAGHDEAEVLGLVRALRELGLLGSRAP